ncbi:hypothetical protein ACFPAF_04100 [Hymenobacter endophyticus]
MDDLRKENQQLKDKLTEVSAKGALAFENIADLDDEIEIIGCGHEQGGEIFSPSIRWQAKTTWRDVFKGLSSKCVSVLSENEVNSIVAANAYSVSDRKDEGLTSNILEDEILHTIRAQFRVLGLFKVKANSYGLMIWSLTARGESEMLNSLVVRKGSSQPI